MNKNNATHHIPSLFNMFSDVIAAESTRLGGVSSFPFSSLNLGLYTNDHIENVKQNRTIFFNNLGIKESEVAHSHQVHSDQILIAHQAGKEEGFDAIISNQPNLFVAITIADCTPVLIYDHQQRVVAAIHAGWRGTVQSIVLKTLQKMQNEFGTNATDCYAYIGTCIDECSFEVDADVADKFNLLFKRWDNIKKKYFIDLKKANKQQLLDFGIPNSQIECSPFSTVLNNDRFFSHRKEKGKTGRSIAIIGIRSEN